MNYVYSTINWIFGIFFLLLGISLLFVSLLSSICLLLISALLLPPVRRFVYSKAHIIISFQNRIFYIALLSVGFIIFTIRAGDTERDRTLAQEATVRAERAARLEQEKIEIFQSERDDIISYVKVAIADEAYGAAFKKANEYLVADDYELNSLHALAKDEMTKIEKTFKTQELLAAVEITSSSNLAKKEELYKALSNLHPGNDAYKEKHYYYAEALRLEEQKRKAEIARKEDLKSQFSSWNGSHRNLVRLIKESMNDPGSYKHVKTVYWDKGDHLVVKTSFRGKNAFGGVVLNYVTAEVSLNGQILEIIDQS